MVLYFQSTSIVQSKLLFTESFNWQQHGVYCFWVLICFDFQIKITLILSRLKFLSNLKRNMSLEIILEKFPKPSCSYLDAYLVFRANSHTHREPQTAVNSISLNTLLKLNVPWHRKPAEWLLMVEHSPCSTCQTWKSCVPCYQQTCPS